MIDATADDLTVPSGLVSAGPPVTTLRPAEATDAAFLRQLWVDSRVEGQLMPPDLIDLQIRAQVRQYELDHPSAVDEVVECRGRPVGRCWTAEDRSTLRVLDLSILADYRRRGIATQVLLELGNRVRQSSGAVRLSVWRTNLDALRLYEKCGFVVIGAAGERLEMRWAPPTTSPAAQALPPPTPVTSIQELEEVTTW